MRWGWGRAFRNWGAMQGTLKLEGREWDESWHCYDVATDPLEKADLGPDACADLRAVAQRAFGGPPGQVDAAPIDGVEPAP